MGYIQEIRKYVGHNPIMVTAAMCIIYDKDKGILLEKRTDNGMWCVPGEHLNLVKLWKKHLKGKLKKKHH